MLNLVILLLTLVSGWASQYSPGVMESTVEARQNGCCAYNLPKGLPPVDGFVAVSDCSNIGRLLLLRPEGSKKWERFLAADCAGPGAYEWMLRNNILVEVDYETAVRWNTVGRGIRVEMRWLNGKDKTQCRRALFTPR